MKRRIFLMLRRILLYLHLKYHLNGVVITLHGIQIIGVNVILYLFPRNLPIITTYIKSNGQGNQFAVYAADIHGWDYSKVVGGINTTYQFINNSGLYVLPMTTTDFTKVDIDWHSTINGSKFNNCTYLWFYAQIGGSATSNSFILRFVPKS